MTKHCLCLCACVCDLVAQPSLVSAVDAVEAGVERSVGTPGVKLIHTDGAK